MSTNQAESSPLTLAGDNPDNLVNFRRREALSHEALLRDINEKIADIENQMLRMALDFGESQKDLRETVRELAAEEHLHSDELEKLTRGLLITRRQQKNLAQQLNEKFDHRVDALSDKLNQGLKRQQALGKGFRHLEQSHKNLQQLHRELRTQVTEQGERLGELQSELAELDTSVATRQQHTNTRVSRLAAVFAGVAIGIVAALAYFEIRDAQFESATGKQFTGVDQSLHNLSGSVVELEQSTREDLALFEADMQQRIDEQESDLQAYADSNDRNFARLKLQALGPGTLQSVSPAPSVPLVDLGVSSTRNPESFTIQLAGFFQRSQLIDHVNLYAPFFGDQPLYELRSSFGTRDWHNLFLGDYADRNAAEAALANLPDRLKLSNPFPRSFASIQNGLDQ